MSAPHTFFSTEFRGGAQAVRTRLQNLLQPGLKKRGTLAMILLLLVILAAGGLVTYRLSSPAPGADPEVLSTLLVRNGEVPTVTVLDSASHKGQTLAVVSAQYPADNAPSLFILALEGSPMAIRTILFQAESAADSWGRIVSQPDGTPLIHFLFADASNGWATRGGGISYNGEEERWVWPAPLDSVAYEDYWSTAHRDDSPAEEDAPPFRLATEVSEEANACMRRLLSQEIYPACQADGVEVLASRLIPRRVGTVETEEPIYPYGSPDLWLLDYRLLPADLDAALSAGYRADSQGWLFPKEETGTPAAILQELHQGPQVMALFYTHSQEDGQLLSEAAAQIPQGPNAPLPDWENLPATTGEDRYDPETGRYFNDALNIGLVIPDSLASMRDQILFRQEVDEGGNPSLVLLFSPVHAWYLEHGGANTGEFLRFTSAGPEAAFGNSFPSSNLSLYRGSNIYGRCLISDTYWDCSFTDYLTPQPVPGLLDAWQEAIVYSDEIAAGFYHNQSLPMDADFTITCWPPDDNTPAIRVGIGSQGDLGLGEPDFSETSRLYVAQEGDYWLRETFDGLTVTSYIQGNTGKKTVTELAATSGSYYYGSYRRSTGIGTPAGEADLCYSGGDFGRALSQPSGQQAEDFFLNYDQVNPTYRGRPYRFYALQSETGLPFPCPYWLEFSFSSQPETGADVISQIHLYADLLEGRDPFIPE